MPPLRTYPPLLALLIALVAGLFAPSGARAQSYGMATQYVDWRATAEPSTVAPGQTVTLRIDAALQDGWKMYALDSPRPSRGVEISFPELPSGFTLREPLRQSDPTDSFDPFFNADVRYFTDEAHFAAELVVSEAASAGTHEVEARVVFQICNESICLPPTPVTVSAPVEVHAGGEMGAAPEQNIPDLTGGSDAVLSPSAPEAADDEVTATGDLDAARAGGLWGFLLLAAGAGLAALLTPCVFPMIPLTVSYFTKHTGSRAESVRMAAVYGGSIVVTFTALGVVTALLVGAAGAQSIAANPWINLFIGAVFVVFALSLLGLFELRLPNGLLNYFNRQSQEHGGYLGVLFMGLTLTLVSFSCTAPFVGGLLAATASDEWAYPVLGMLAFSATFSLPFVVFALFPKGLQALPRSGSWMNTVKVVLGFVELAAALKFLSNADLVWGWGLISRPLAIALVAVIFFLAGFYLIGKLPLHEEEKNAPVGVVPLLFAILFFGGSLYLLPGLFGAPLNAVDAYLPPRQAGDVSLLAALPREAGGDASAEEFEWKHDVEAAYAAARAEGKPVFIDFTGYTCTNCRQMEANVFPRPAVAERLRNDFVLLRLYTDDAERGPDLQRFQLQLTGTVALPTYAIVDPHGERLVERATGVATADEFAAFLDRGAARFQKARIAEARTGESPAS